MNVMRALMLLLLCLTARAEEDVVIKGDAFGSTWSVTIANPPAGLKVEEVRAECEKTLARIDKAVSTYRNDSDLARFAVHKPDVPMEISADTAAIAKAAQDLCMRTGGTFDPTVAPLMRIWGLHSAGPQLTEPTPAALSAVLAVVGCEIWSVRVDDEVQARKYPFELWKYRAGVQLDFSAIAPGYAADQLAKLVTHRFGIKTCLVDVGGELVAVNMRQPFRAWTIGLEAPDPLVRALFARVQIFNGALSTSGDYRRAVEIAGKRRTHIINPHSGIPLEQRGMAVVVIHSNAMEADAFATSLMVHGPEYGFPLAEMEKFEALFLIQKDGMTTMQASPGFPKLLPLENVPPSK